MFHQKILPLLLEGKESEARNFLAGELRCTSVEAQTVINEFKKAQYPWL